MLPALVATFLWSYCVIAARRSVEQLGENAANLARLVLALVVMGVIAYAFGLGHGGGGLWFFFLSGIIGFGLGDIGIFYALPRIGTRLTLLLAQCLAAPIAGLAEWFWMGTTISNGQFWAIVVILAGISVALVPKQLVRGTLPAFLVGVAFGVLAGVGQGLGAVLSRRAYLQAHLASNWTGEQGVLENIIMGSTAGYQRLLGGLATLLLFCLLTCFVRQWRTYPRPERARDPWPDKLKYVVLTAASGPIFGIMFFQWALATTPSVIVQPIVAMTPLLVMPLSYFLEGDRPPLRAIFGSCVSVAGVIALALAS